MWSCRSCAGTFCKPDGTRRDQRPSERARRWSDQFQRGFSHETNCPTHGLPRIHESEGRALYEATRTAHPDLDIEFRYWGVTTDDYALNELADRTRARVNSITAGATRKVSRQRELRAQREWSWRDIRCHLTAFPTTPARTEKAPADPIRRGPFRELCSPMRGKLLTTRSGLSSSAHMQLYVPKVTG